MVSSNWEREETHVHLNRFYRIVKDQLIKYQHPFSGLFPRRPEALAHDCVAHIRDNVYCATAIWALHRSFQRSGDDSGQSYELRQSAVKCMRAILLGWMRQADRLENFKTNQNLETCLHTRLDYETGTPVEGTGYKHLQMDCVGLYIIHTKVEAAFIQNLVFYLERAYRIPDYGMWERGSKQNRDITELHASSIGMAKAALESVLGFNIFGTEGDHTTVMLADADAHTRNSSILSTLLPRESASKGTDAALITTISWPAFAIHIPSIVEATMERVDMLKGTYGYKRFTRDGYATVLETNTLYSQGELSKFLGIESEWPMFFAYRVIGSFFNQQLERAEQFAQLMEPLIVHPISEKYPWLPKYYFVPEGSVDAERANPGSQARRSNFKLRMEPRFLWGQSVYIISQMLLKGVLTIHDLDPLGRHSPANIRPMSLISRYSTITSRPATMCIQMILLAESNRLQQILATYGIRTQTPVEIEPLKLWPPATIVKAFAFMGFNKRLGLKGRPPRPLGCLGTSKFYRVCGSTVLVFSHLFEDESFYFGYDIKALIEDVKNDLIFLSKWWRMKGRPSYCFLVKEDMIIGHGRDELIRFLVSLQSNCVDGVRIVLGRAQNFVATGCTDHLDFFPDWAAQLEEFGGLKRLHGGRSFLSLSDLPRILDDKDFDSLMPAPLVIAVSEAVDRRHFENKSDDEIVAFVCHDGDRRELWPYRPPVKDAEAVFESAAAVRALDYAQEVAALHELMHRHSLDYILRPNEELSTVRDFFTNLSRRAGLNQIWTVVRLTSALLGNYVHSLAPSTSSILVFGKQLTIGTVQGPEVNLNKPMNPRQLCDLLQSTVFPVNPLLVSLQQELILYVSALLIKDKSLFKGIAIIRLGWLLEAMKLQLEAEEARSATKCDDGNRNGKCNGIGEAGQLGDAAETLTEARSLGACRLYSLSPSSLKSLLYRTLCSDSMEHSHNSHCPWRRSSPHLREESPAPPDEKSPEDVLFQRQLDGCLGRVPNTFYESVYHILERAPCGVLIASNLLPQNPTLTDMTPHDLNLVVEVERMLSDVKDPAYRALFVETVMVIAVILERNQELSFTEVVDFRLVIQNAIKDFAIINHISFNEDSRENRLATPTRHSKRRLSWPENEVMTDNWEAYTRFASTPANIRLGTTSFLAKASIALLLHGTINLSDPKVHLETWISAQYLSFFLFHIRFNSLLIADLFLV
ncbi:phosphorylase b kinase regulatory [Echinococcus multilocularis]|uniref:Phosphorylase b kinase regulatory subunit n=1 Tax=Echinococcus multilocularis TaxID=6211 RepID=A0A087W0Q7_ECHMU|nr:phosphorylase b kinase regulatory [Echinococcus multilocularis]